MTKLARIAVAAAVLLGGTSLATAKTRGVPTPHIKPFHPGFNETTSGHTAANPYYRLSDQYYDYSDPYRGLYNFFAVPPYVPGYTYGHVKMPLRWRQAVFARVAERAMQLRWCPLARRIGIEPVFPPWKRAAVALFPSTGVYVFPLTYCGATPSSLCVLLPVYGRLRP
jgi:hypothetical protein